MASTKPKILIQLDTDPQPSVFDAVVAVDAGVDHLFRHGGVTPENVRDLVYGALFTRGPADLHGHGDLHRRLGRGGRRGGAGGGQGDVLRPVPGLGALRRQRRQHDGRGGRAGGLAGLRRLARRGSRRRSWRRPARSASASPGCWPGWGRRSPSARAARPRQASWPRRSRQATGARVTPFADDRPGRPGRGARGQVGRHRAPGPRGSRSCPPSVWQELARAQGPDRPERRPAAGYRRDRGHRQGNRARDASAPGVPWASAAPR